MPLFQYNEGLLHKILRDNRNRYGYVTRNAALLFWNTDMIQKKVDYGIRYFGILSNNNKDFAENDIKSELYLIFCDSLVLFDPNHNSCFSTYYNMAVVYRMQRFFQQNIIENVAFASNKKDKKPVIDRSSVTETGDLQSIETELRASHLFDEDELAIMSNIMTSPETIRNMQGVDTDEIKRKIKQFLAWRKKQKTEPMPIKKDKFNFLDTFEFTGKAVKDETGEIIVTTDGFTLSFDNLPGADSAIKTNETYKITIEWIKTPTKKEIKWQA